MQTLDCLLSCVLFFSFPHSQPSVKGGSLSFTSPFSLFEVSASWYTRWEECVTLSLHHTPLSSGCCGIWGSECERSEQGFLFSALVTFGDGYFFLVGLAYVL